MAASTNTGEMAKGGRISMDHVKKSNQFASSGGPIEYASGALSREQIRALIQSKTPLVGGVQDLEVQLQPNGFDLTLAEVHRYQARGVLAVDNAGRQLPTLEQIPFSSDDYLDLEQGIYHVLYNQTVHSAQDL